VAKVESYFLYKTEVSIIASI